MISKLSIGTLVKDMKPVLQERIVSGNRVFPILMELFSHYNFAKIITQRWKNFFLETTFYN